MPNIGKSAFRDCTNLTTITIPEGMTKIGPNSFLNCTHITSIVIPSTVIEIMPNAFKDCAALTSVTIPATVTKIGSHAFQGATELTISGYSGSEAQTYANTGETSIIPFIDLSTPTPPVETYMGTVYLEAESSTITKLTSSMQITPVVGGQLRIVNNGVDIFVTVTGVAPNADDIFTDISFSPSMPAPLPGGGWVNMAAPAYFTAA